MTALHLNVYVDMSKMGQGINQSLFIVIKKILTIARGKNLQSMPMRLKYRPNGLLYMPLSMFCTVANSSVSHLVAPSRIYELVMKGKFVIYLLPSIWEFFLNGSMVYCSSLYSM